MLVRKFDGHSIDDVLQKVKKELGPDAIILKTTSPKGIKGAFRGKKFEITAAISESGLKEKQKIDSLLTPEQKQDLYSKSSEKIKKSLSSRKTPVRSQGYSDLGLNRQTKAKKTEGEQNKASTVAALKGGLDDFLMGKEEEQGHFSSVDSFIDEQERIVTEKTTVEKRDLEQQLSLQQKAIEELRDQVAQLQQSKQVISSPHKTAIKKACDGLLSLGISERIVSKLSRKLQFELADPDNEEQTYDLILRELHGQLKCEQISLSDIQKGANPPITLLLSEVACGQTTMALKLASIYQGVEYVEFAANERRKVSEHLGKLLDVSVHSVGTTPELIDMVNQLKKKNRPIIVDLKLAGNSSENILQALGGIQRALQRPETLLCLSALHSEQFNSTMLQRYKKSCQGVVLNYLDFCVNYASILNLFGGNEETPLKMFGVGDKIPEDLEAATPERILAGLFAMN